MSVSPVPPSPSHCGGRCYDWARPAASAPAGISTLRVRISPRLRFIHSDTISAHSERSSRYRKDAMHKRRFSGCGMLKHLNHFTIRVLEQFGDIVLNLLELCLLQEA